MVEPMDGLGPRETLAALEQSSLQQVRAECAQLELVVHWALQHAGQAVRPGVVPGLERPLRFGGEGTPEVAEFAPVDIGAVLGLADWQARALVADALDLRYRLPRLWELVQAGRVHAWRARRIAQRTRTLSADAARQVDAEVWESVESLPWQRFSDFLESRVLLADTNRAVRLAEHAKRARYVIVSKRPRFGMKTIRIRVDAADAIQFDASVARIAGALRDADAAGEAVPGVGDRGSQSQQEFRAQSIGVLAQPLLAAQVMVRGKQPELFDPAQDNSAARVEDDLETLNPVVTPPVDDHLDQPLPEWLLKTDLSRLLPQAVLHVHISETALRSRTGVVRVESVGAVLAEQVRTWLGSGVQLRIQPIIDANDMTPVDAYEIPDRMREAVRSRSPASCFPFSTSVSRRMDLDHTLPYQRMREGPPGQTWPGNLGPLSRSEHRVKTHGGWRVRQPVPGSYVWRSAYGYVYVVNQTGTHALGRNDFSDLVWSAAAPTSLPASAAPRSGPMEVLFREFLHDLGTEVEIEPQHWRHSAC